MSHLTPAEVIDGCEGTLRPERASHVASCERCQEAVRRAGIVLADVRGEEMPEPSPLFWERFSASVGAAVRDEGVPRASWRWRPVLVPAAAAALVLLVLLIGWNDRQAAPPVQPAPSETVAADRTPEPDTSAAGWELIADLADDTEWDHAELERLAVEPGTVEEWLVGLEADEREALGELLQAELRRLAS